MPRKSGPTPLPMPKTSKRVGFVNLIPNQRPSDVPGKPIKLKKPKN